jgi:hypothetical protein
MKREREEKLKNAYQNKRKIIYHPLIEIKEGNYKVYGNSSISKQQNRMNPT